MRSRTRLLVALAASVLACGGPANPSLPPTAPASPAAPEAPERGGKARHGGKAPGRDRPARGKEAVLASLTRPASVEICDGPCTEHPVRPMAVGVADASSELIEGSLTHSAALARDGDPKTAWCEGVDGDGIGQALWFAVDNGIPWGIGLVPGHAADGKRWTTNGRVSQVVVQFLKPAPGAAAGARGRWDRDDLVPTETPGVLVRMATADGAVVPMKTQYVLLEDQVTQNDESTEFVAIELRIVDVEKGTTYPDTCVSEVEFLGLEL